MRRIVETKIKPELGRTKITELTVADVKAWHEGMKATPYEANRALAFLSKMPSLAAKQWQLRADNPCSAVQRFPERERERYFSDAELTHIGGALAAAERGGTELPGFILLVRLLAPRACGLANRSGSNGAMLPPGCRPTSRALGLGLEAQKAGSKPYAIRRTGCPR